MTSGPSSEPATILSAAISFLVFLCYFAYVLISVPRHWGVPYKNRFVPPLLLLCARGGLCCHCVRCPLPATDVQAPP